MAVAMDGTGYPNNICLALYDPSQKSIFSQCSDSYHGGLSVGANQKLTVTGLYTMVVTAAGNNAIIKYGASLERLYPAPPDGRQITLGQAISDEINPLTDWDAFTFVGATTGTYRINGSIATGGYTSDLCMQVFWPDGTGGPAQCTDSYHGGNSIQMDVTPLQNGTHVVLVWEAGYDGTVGYNLNVACLVGNCGSPFPACTLKDVPSYDSASGTLTMNFTVGNKFNATWNAWLTYQNTMESLFSATQPITDPPITVTKTRANLPKSGKVGILSTLTHVTKGITCSSWVQVDTGAP